MAAPPIPGNQSRWVSQEEGGQNRPSRDPTQRMATASSARLLFPCRACSARQAPVCQGECSKRLTVEFLPLSKKSAVHTPSNEYKRSIHAGRSYKAPGPKPGGSALELPSRL